MARTTFRTFPGFTDIDPTDASSIDGLLDFHRATFGDAQMRRNEDDGDDGDDEGDDDGQDGQDGQDGDGADDDDGDGDGPARFVDSTGKTWDFPANTRVKDMTAEEASEYWRHKSQKHEKENERLRRRPKTTRRSQGRSADDGDRDDGADDHGDDDVDAEQARAAERDVWAPRLVRSEMRRFLPSRLTDEQVEAIVAPINHSHFLTSDGEVDTDKVKKYANSVSPGTSFPGTGQGRERGENSGRGSVSSAKEDYVESRRKKR